MTQGMRLAIVGLGIQGRKRRAIAGENVAAVVDPVVADASYRTILDVPLDLYDAAMVCTPDDSKFEILKYLITRGKHVLVEKPLLSLGGRVQELAELAQRHQVVCYTAYNHRFEPHVARAKAVIEAGTIGEIFRARLFYGNGTARDVRGSPWRDRGAGVITDLASHLLDLCTFWFGRPTSAIELIRASRFENKAPDNAVLASHGRPALDFEVSLLNWRNDFTADIIGAGGSIHIRSLCKWGPATFILRHRKLPSGRPDEEEITLTQPDPTWAAEYVHFLGLCAGGKFNGNIVDDIWIDATLSELARAAA